MPLAWRLFQGRRMMQADRTACCDAQKNVVKHGAASMRA